MGPVPSTDANDNLTGAELRVDYVIMERTFVVSFGGTCDSPELITFDSGHTFRETAAAAAALDGIPFDLFGDSEDTPAFKYDASGAVLSDLGCMQDYSPPPSSTIRCTFEMVFPADSMAFVMPAN